jgi:hypothetical protein
MIGEGDCGEIGGMKIEAMVIVEKLVEWILSGETEVLGKNLHQRHFAHHKSHMIRLGFQPGPPRWEASDWPLELWRGPAYIYSAAFHVRNAFVKLD